ncbi:MAG: dynamin family protein, partial [Deltaproteobacteria bacterium]|nr:dynamin family protein [Deltaproteobacteria bacterium]
MDAYNALKDEILQINRDVLGLFSKAKSIPGMADYSFGDWEKTCAHLPAQLAEGTIRVAIAGTIKSGKSTFLNSILKGEYVKRGAGVITSIVTRVRNGKRLRAKLFFKSWDEINAEMEQALVLFPSASWRSQNGRFDIRQENERLDLQRALSQLSADQLITQSTRNINNVLLSSYLKGYKTVASLLSSEKATQLYEEDQFSNHKAFVGDESLAVYLRDVLLEINSSVVASNVEIADCQGSDSSNPMHLAMIQDYLLLTHLIIYVISSRTGLRQADIRFLSIIKKMGILDNIAFVVNCDFSEHDSIADLGSLIDRVREELSMIKPNPDVYSFSTLYNLFSSQKEDLSDKDRLRFKQWESDGELTELAKRETRRFESDFYDRLARKRFSLLMQNHIERLGVILVGIDDWINLNRDVLTKDANGAAEILGKIRIHQKRFNKIQSAIKKTLAGTIPEIKRELQREVHRFFDAQSGMIAKDLGNHIRAYTFSPDHYQGNLKDGDFSKTLYLVFQEFKQSIDSYITEVINPEVIKFVKFREMRIREHFEALINPFDTMLENAYEEINGML